MTISFVYKMSIVYVYDVKTIGIKTLPGNWVLLLCGLNPDYFYYRNDNENLNIVMGNSISLFQNVRSKSKLQ